MAELLPNDVLEKIMIGLDVKDLIRCKCVCKSWKSFISSSRFVKAQLTYSYNNDRNNMEFGHRRIMLSRVVIYASGNFYCGTNLLSFIGSSNGLVCVSPPLRNYSSEAQVFVANPLTRELKKLQYPLFPDYDMRSILCWGFGYDKFTDDYKVIVGLNKGKDRTLFQVLSLKTNVWKDIGESKYTFVFRRSFGIYYNGAVHWFMNDLNLNGVIVSFDISEEEFKEIPQPQNVTYKYNSSSSLGIFEECLCIFKLSCSDIWVMKNYNVKESWEVLLAYVPMKVNDVVHYLDKPGDYHPHRSFFIEDCRFESKSWDKCLCAPVFVQSIVSPHGCERLKRKIDDCNR